MTKKLIPALGLVLIASLMLPATAFAAEPAQGQVVMGGNFKLEAGETLDGDLVVFGGNIDLQAESLVDGDVFLLGGNADIDGEVAGDLALLGGNVDLGASAVVQGDLFSMGGSISRAQGAEIGGDTMTADEFSVPFDFRLPRASRIVGPFDSVGFRFSPVWSVLWFGFRSLLFAALAILVVMFWPDPTARAAGAVVSQPILSGGLGLLTIIVAPILLLVLLITIVLSPVSLLGLILLIVAGMFGWIAIGLEVGDRLAEAFKWDLHPAAAAGVGTLAMSLVVGGIGLIPCIGWMAGFVAIAIGLGAVLLTRFGSREYVPAVAQPPAKAETPAKSSRSKKK